MNETIPTPEGGLAAPDALNDAERLQAYRRVKRQESRKALLLATPLLLFLLITFIAPIGTLLLRSVQNPEVPLALPEATKLLQHWDEAAMPGADIYAAMAQDLVQASKQGKLGRVARRMNFYNPAMRSLLLKTARKLKRDSRDDLQAALLASDSRWGDKEIWRVLKRAGQSPTPDYLLNAVDSYVDKTGSVASLPPEESVYLAAFSRTIWISTSVTLLCLLLAYPVAWLLANLPARQGRKLMLLVIIPFWTSLLVRTTAWYVLLQPNGVINSLLSGLGLVSQPIPLVFNRTGVLIGMTHIMLPFMILAIYSVMKGISPVYLRAAQSLGAKPLTAFIRVYVPQTLAGVGAGCFLVFVLSLGYYITPALLGGAGDEMISQLISIQTNQQLNWGLAGALSAYLVIFTAIFYFIFNRLVGIDRLRFG
ncbi:ABC transporter permease [Oceanobacter sp. 3_MG-2023]|uniref:ABC transporter permease n=1 Tax=Oceanobacter sp. 3_MG-2023 TaxID=3062622 RepID=UPI002733D914|nr:ABC transporter permease [Oceanobacter sp. 3_MG-2023]MDP2506021.1 ABC transporter permease [Oceanobacter sp. 3_MG-2023]